MAPVTDAGNPADHRSAWQLRSLIRFAPPMDSAEVAATRRFWTFRLLAH
jgi:hypothetical protein